MRGGEEKGGREEEKEHISLQRLLLPFISFVCDLQLQQFYFCFCFCCIEIERSVLELTERVELTTVCSSAPLVDSHGKFTVELPSRGRNFTVKG